MIVKYHDNGSIASEYNYIDNKKHGVCIDYYINGNKSKEYMYKFDLKDGICINYYSNGKIICEYTCKDGYREGIFISYNMCGVKEIEYIYKQDYLDSICIDFYEDGKTPQCKIKYIDGIVSAISDCDSNGIIRKERKFNDVNDDENDIFNEINRICYYINNKVKSSQKICHQKVESSIEYYKSGYKKFYYKNKIILFY